jgi:ferredoxin
MKVKVDKDLCAACGPCEEICPEIFKIEDDVAIVQMDVVPKELEEKARRAVDECPTGAIIIVEE